MLFRYDKPRRASQADFIWATSGLFVVMWLDDGSIEFNLGSGTLCVKWK